MNRSKLIPILKSLSKSEIKEFDKFLNSPFFGCKQFVLNFYREIIKYYPDFSNEDIAKEKIFNALYPKRKYNDSLTRRIMSDLIKFAEEYLKYKNFSNNGIYQNSSLLNELNKRNLSDQFRVRSVSILKKIETSEHVDPNLLLESYFINMEMNHFRTFIRDSKMHESFSAAVEVFVVLFLRLINSYINHVNTFSNEIKTGNDITSALFENFDFKSFLNHLENNDDSRYSKYMKMIFYIHNIASDKDDRKSYFKLTELIETNPGYFTKEELKNIYVQVIIFYAYQNKNYDNRFISEEFELYNKFLTEYYLPDPLYKLQLSYCRNYINLCKQNEKIEMIRDFYKLSVDHFPKEHKEDMFHLCEAVYLFENKMFEASLSHATKVNIDREAFKRDMRILKLKLYYELGYYESVLNEIDNFRYFLTSSKNSTEEVLKKGINFAGLLSSLVKLKSNTGKSKSDLHVLKKQLEKERNIYEKKWLGEQLLINNY